MKQSEDQPVVERIAFMRRRFHPNARRFRGPLAVVPLVNVVLLLVLFVIANASFVLQPGIMVSLPDASFADGATYGPIVVTISQEGIVFFNDGRTTLEGLGSAFAQAALDHPDAPLVIEADGRVSHSTIVQIYNMAMSAGIKKVLLATRVSTSPPRI